MIDLEVALWRCNPTDSVVLAIAGLFVIAGLVWLAIALSGGDSDA